MCIQTLHQANMPPDSLVPEILKISRNLCKTVSLRHILYFILCFTLNTMLVQSHDEFHILANRIYSISTHLNDLASFKYAKSSGNNNICIYIIPGNSGYKKNSQIFQRLKDHKISFQFFVSV